MKDELLTLESDKDWSLSRPRPIEPYRMGQVAVLDETELSQYELLTATLTKRNRRASYIDPTLVPRQYRHDPLFALAETFASQDRPATAAITSSLLFPLDELEAISQRVQIDLAAIQLGPNQELISKVVALINTPEMHTWLTQTAAKKSITICDPFGGGGVLAYYLADALEKSIGDRFTIKLIDLSDTAYKLTGTLIGRLGKKRFQKLHTYIEYHKGDGLIFEGIAPHSCDIIVSTLSLHEHSDVVVEAFFKKSLTMLAEDGHLLIADTTREKRILSRVEKRMRFLSKIGMYVVSLKYAVGGPKDTIGPKLFESAKKEHIWLAQSGLASYRCGYLKEELERLAKNAGLSRKYLHVWYDFSAPMGAVVLTYENRKTQD